MSWRVIVVSHCAKLDYQLGYMVIRTDEKKKIHLSEISHVIIETTAVSITAALLCELTKKKIKVIFCDEKRNPSSELVSYYGSHDTSAKIRNQITWDSERRLAIWTEIVTEKIRQQAFLLEKWRCDEAELLKHYIEEIEFGDATNREGHAAKVYFNALFSKEFTRSDDSSINAALNYGYSLILSCFTREIVSNGYLTQLGLFHDNMFNQFNLASDLMEPYRPIVDDMVKNLSPEEFGSQQKHYMLELFQKTVTIAGRKEYVSNAIKIYCKSVFDALSSGDASLIKFYRN